MGKEKYDLLMGEIDVIAEKVNLFPEHLQESVFDALHSALMDKDNQKVAVAEDSEVKEVQPVTDTSSGKTEIEDRDHVAEIKKHVSEFNLGSVTDIEFALYAAYYFTMLAHDDHKVSAITQDDLKKAVSIAGRKPPKNSGYSSTLSNARRKGYLENPKGKKGTYQVTDVGEYYVKNTLLKSNS